MKNFKLVLVIVGLAIVGGTIYKVTTASIKKPEVMMKKDLPVTETPKQEVMEKKGESANSRYLSYSKTVFDTSSDKRRILYFYATWCPTCKIANEDFTANPNKIPEDMVVIRTNYNDPETDQEEKELAKKYGISYQHTFVQIDAQGKELKKWNGGGIAELITNTTN